FPRQPDFPTADWAGSPPTASTIEGESRDFMVFRSIEPGANIDLTLAVEGYASDPFGVRLTASALDLAEQNAVLRDLAEVVRHNILETADISLPPSFMALLDDPNEWWRYVSDLLIKFGLLDRQSPASHIQNRLVAPLVPEPEPGCDPRWDDYNRHRRNALL